MEEYHREFSKKVNIAPKVLKMLWLKEEKLDDVREALRFQKLEKFVRLSGNVYPDLSIPDFVRVKIYRLILWVL